MKGVNGNSVVQQRNNLIMALRRDEGRSRAGVDQLIIAGDGGEGAFSGGNPQAADYIAGAGEGTLWGAELFAVSQASKSSNPLRWQKSPMVSPFSRACL